MSTSEQVQALPLWVNISAAALFIILVVGGPLFIGWGFERRRTAPARAAEKKGAKRWVETGELDLNKVREEEQRRDNYRRLASQPRTEEAVGVSILTDSSPVQVIQDDRSTLILPAVPRRELETAPVAGYSPYSGAYPTAVEVWRNEDGTAEVLELSHPFEPESEPPAWARDDTAEWDLGAILEAEVVDTETEAERLFWADPLGAWVLPPESEAPDYLPLADKAFWALVNREILSGEGANVDTIYTPLFTDYELEEVYA